MVGRNTDHKRKVDEMKLNERIDLKKAYLKGERRAFSDISIKLFGEIEDCFKKFKTEVKYDGDVIRFNDKNIEELINKISKIKENQEKILEKDMLIELLNDLNKWN